MQNKNATIIIILVAILLGGLFVYNISQKQNTMSDGEAMMEESKPSEDTMMNDDKMGDTEMMEDKDLMEGEDSMMDDETHKTFEVAGGMFYFTPEELVVNEGDTVTIKFTNEGGMHDWNLDEFDAHTDVINTGETTEVTFVADTAGTYEYYCSVANHRAQGMVGTLIVE